MDMTTPMDQSKGRFALKVLGIVLLATIIIVSILRDRIVNFPQWQVSVVGQGKVAYVPDTAVLKLGYQTYNAQTPSEAITRVTRIIDSAIPDLVALGIAEEDITTGSYSLSPQYASYGEGAPMLRGYEAGQSLTVKIASGTSTQDILNRAVTLASARGMNQIALSFEASNMEALKQEARLLAMADAKAKAGAQAKTLDVKLGKVIGWWENFVMPTPYYGGYGMGGGFGGDMMIESKGGFSSIPVGQNEIVVELSVNYQVK